MSEEILRILEILLKIVARIALIIIVSCSFRLQLIFVREKSRCSSFRIADRWRRKRAFSLDDFLDVSGFSFQSFFGTIICYCHVSGWRDGRFHSLTISPERNMKTGQLMISVADKWFRRSFLSSSSTIEIAFAITIADALSAEQVLLRCYFLDFNLLLNEQKISRRVLIRPKGRFSETVDNPLPSGSPPISSDAIISHWKKSVISGINSKNLISYKKIGSWKWYQICNFSQNQGWGKSALANFQFSLC